MKNLIKLLFITIIFTSCGYAPIDNSKPVIITEIEQYESGYCYYYGYGNGGMTLTPASYNFIFKDSCGKYQIGDTVKFSK